MTKTQRKAARTAAARRAVVYARVSTDEQLTSGAGMDAQVAECLAYAGRAGLTVVAVVCEDPISGKVHPELRPGFVGVLSMLEEAEAGTLLIRREDRVSRRLRHMLDVIDAATDSGWTIATCDGQLDTASADGAFKVHLMAALAERERRVIGERTREALAALTASGVKLGRPRLLAPEVGAQVVAWRNGGATFQAIADRLNDAGTPTATGAAWTRLSARKASLTYA